MGLALYRDLYRSLTIRISKDRFNVKKHRSLYLNWPTFLVFSALSKTRLYRGGANCTALLLRLTLNLEETLSSNKINDHKKSKRLIAI